MLKKEGLYFIPLGGADEIGLNMYVYVVDGKMIVVDCGYGFLNDDYPGMDMALPDASFLEDYQDKIEGLFITHAHEDHFGAIGHIWPKLKCPVYATDFACGMIRERLKDFHLEIPLHSVGKEKRVKLETFDVEFAFMVHNAVETSALIIRNKYGTSVHATDWRFDDGAMKMLPTDFGALEQASKEGVKLFVCDSTNVLVEKDQKTESETRESLFELIPTFKKGLITTCFPSNLVRLESLILAAHLAGRTPVLMGYSLIKHMQIAKECGYFQDLPHYVTVMEAKDIPSDKAMYICTGSQANYRSALTLIANGDSKWVKLSKGDAVLFSSKVIPGNEEKIERMQEKIRAQDVEVITEKDHFVHTSGHPGRKELEVMYNLLKPEIVLPVHGEKEFIEAHEIFAKEHGIKEVITSRNGDVILVNNHKAEKVGKVFTDVLGVDRKQLTSLGSQLIKNRKRLAFNCSVFISVVFDEVWNLKDLQISSIDILEETAWKTLVEEIKQQMLELIKIRIGEFNNHERQISDFIKSQIRKKIEKQTGIKPVVFYHLFKE